jgi:integrase
MHFLKEIEDEPYKNLFTVALSIGRWQSDAPRSMRVHDLQHSLALKCGDSSKDVLTNLGHSTVTITLDLYSHVPPK